MKKDIIISIVIPVYNGSETIKKIVDELINQLYDFYLIEIILVNDCSTDSSSQVCTLVHNEHKKIVKFYDLAKNVGEHNAVMAGLNQVTGNYIVIMDDDFQNPINEVKNLIEEIIKKGCDVVYTYYEKKHHSIYRNIGSNFNNYIATIMLKKPKNLYLSSFKIMNRFLVDEVIKYELPFPYIDGLILRTTSNIGKLKVAHNKREKGESGYTLRKLISLWLNMFTNFSIVPLRAVIFVGAVFGIIGLFLGVYTIFEKIIYPDLPIGFATITFSIFVFAGIQLIALGMIGEYIGRIFLSQNKKPQYTIKRRFEK